MHKQLLNRSLAIGIIVLFIGVGIHPVFAAESRTTNKLKELNINKTIFNNNEIFFGFRIIRGTISNRSFGDGYFEFHAERVVNFNFSIFKGNLIPIISREIIENRNYRIYQMVNYTGFIGKNYIFLFRNYTD